MDWVPRSLRQKSKELEKAYFVTGNELGRAATDKEVAEHLGISVKQLQKDISEVSSSALMSLEDFLEQNYEIGVSAPNSNRAEESPEQHAEMEDLKKILGDAIDKLTEREKLVVTLYYFEELTLKEISAIMGVSESRVSQLHSRSILRLKGRLDKHKSLF
jgi:RNA polymerase sigma factor for flagellar operon FliA